MIGLLLAIFGGAVGLLLWLVKQEPPFFESARVEDVTERKQLALEFERRFFNFIPAIFVNNDPEWSEQFTAEQINSYLEVECNRWSLMESLTRSGASTPRVSLEDGIIRVGLRYGQGWWSTVVSIDVKVWLPAVQQNMIAVELQGVHAGGLPLSTRNLIERFTELTRQLPVDITWYRHDGHPVAIIRLLQDPARPALQLDRLAITPGRIEISGRSGDSSHLQVLSTDTARSQAIPK
jgi:hypothetical protein